MKTLDLHGVRYEDAERAVVHFIEDCWGSGEDEAEIITGHSLRMRGLVLNIAKEYDATCKVGGEIGIDDSFIKVVF
jgi:dsDNA-specific endonuclease/ATPase MutS2